MRWPLLLFLKSFSSAWCNSFLRIDRLFCSFLPFLFFWLHWTRKSWSYIVLLWTNIIKKKTNSKNELHKLFLSLNHHPSSFYWVIHYIKRFTFFIFLAIIFFSSPLMFAHCYSRFVYSYIMCDYVDKPIQNLTEENVGV